MGTHTLPVKIVLKPTEIITALLKSDLKMKCTENKSTQEGTETLKCICPHLFLCRKNIRAILLVQIFLDHNLDMYFFPLKKMPVNALINVSHCKVSSTVISRTMSTQYYLGIDLLSIIYIKEARRSVEEMVTLPSFEKYDVSASRVLKGLHLLVMYGVSQAFVILPYSLLNRQYRYIID